MGQSSGIIRGDKAGIHQIRLYCETEEEVLSGSSRDDSDRPIQIFDDG
jgi:hypothetical protein